MADLALGAAGVALAWKGIIDFCELVAKVLHDDAKDRRALILRVKFVRMTFEDWGTKFGVGDPKGEFAAFDDNRKKLIVDLLHAQLEQSVEIESKLQKYDRQSRSNAGVSPFGRSISSARDKLRKSADKAMWVAIDEKAVADMIENLERLSRSLLDLTQMWQLSQQTHGRLSIDQIKAVFKDELKGLDHMWRTAQSQNNTVDDRDAARLAVTGTLRDIEPIAVLERVELFALKVFLEPIDSSVSKELQQWYFHDTTTFICAETSFDSDHDASALACAELYALADQPKLIYIPDRLSILDGKLTLADMLESLTRQAVHHLTRHKQAVSLPAPVPQRDVSDHEMRGESQILMALLSQILDHQKPLLLAIESLELMSLANPGIFGAAEHFVRSLRTVADNSANGRLRCASLGPGRVQLFDANDDNVRLVLP